MILQIILICPNKKKVDLFIEGQASSLITSYMSKKYTISGRQARRIAIDASKVFSSDIEETDLIEKR